MESKCIKLKIHPRNYCEADLIANTDLLNKEKFHLSVGDIVEIVSSSNGGEQDADRPPLLLQVEALSQEIQTKGGPLSVNKELALMFNLESGKDVHLRNVDKEEVGIDLLELKFKDQCLNRSDMWRFTCPLIGKCVYVGKKLEFAGMRVQVSEMWSLGEKVQCGAIVNSTRVVFRSASAQMFLFIQISSEMWEFDASGDLYFDKAVSGFLKELFKLWQESSCNHEVTLMFFWRVYYNQTELEQLPTSVRNSVQQDKRGHCYEDFYKVIVEAESVQDWSSKVVKIKAAFTHVKQLLANNRGEVEMCRAAEGNVLEAINLAVNVFENQYIDCNFLLTGQQVVVVTAGVGVFEVDHELTRLTKERIIDGGVGVDLVSLTEQPLHAIPLFRFHSHGGALDDQEYYHIPHWINYSFYNPPDCWNRFHFNPKIQLSDHLINRHLKRGERRTKGTNLFHPFVDPTDDHASSQLQEDRLLNWIDYDEHDAAIFTSGAPEPTTTSKTVSMNKMYSNPKMKSGSSSTKSMEIKVLARHHSHEDGLVSSTKDELSLPVSPGVVFGIGGSLDEDQLEDPFSGPEASKLGRLASSPGSHSTGGIDFKARKFAREQSFTSSVQTYSRARTQSESGVEPSSSYIGDSSVPAPGSAESLQRLAPPRQPPRPKVDSPSVSGLFKKKRTFINPFDPSKMHTDLTAYHRRWMHTFPRNKEGLAFQVHHVIPEEEVLGSSRSSSFTLTPTKSILQASNNSLQISTEATQSGTKKDNSRLLDDQKSSSNQPKDTNTSSGTDKDVRTNTAGTTATSSLQKPSTNTLTATGSSSSRPNRPHLQPQSSPLASSGSPALKTFRKSKLYSFHRHSFDRQMKSVEDFAAVRRKGMDWRSLTEPACLPITTDFYPTEKKLEQSYFEYPSKFVVNSYSSGYPGASAEESVVEKVILPWRTDHQSINAFQAFIEMISQRLSQGFQLAFDSTAKGRKTSTQDSVFSLYKALKDLEAAIKSRKSRGRRDIVVKLSLGRVFQKVELAYPDITIYIYKAKIRDSTTPLSYTYQLCGLSPMKIAGLDAYSTQYGEETFETLKCKFCHTKVEDYNWNYLDQHVCGYSDFVELIESLKSWRCRFVLLPSSVPQWATIPSDRRETHLAEEKALVAGFVRFLEFLNHIKRSPRIHGREIAPAAFKRHNSLPANLYPLSGLRSPVSHDSHSNITSPLTVHTSRNRKLSEIGEEDNPSSTSPSHANSDHKREHSEPRPSHHRTTPDHFKGRPNTPDTSKRSGAPPSPRTGFLVSERDFSSDGNKRRGSSLERPRRAESDDSKVGRHSQRPKREKGRVHIKYRLREDEHLKRHPRPRDDMLPPQEKEEEPWHSNPNSPRPGEGSPKLLRRNHRGEELMERSKKEKELNFAGGGGVKSHMLVDTHKYLKSTASVPVEITPPTPTTPTTDGTKSELASGDNASPSSSFDGIDVALSTESSPIAILTAMEKEDDGIDFLSVQSGLKPGCFIAMEAVNWVMERVLGVESRKDAVKIMQMLMTQQKITHASGDITIPFIDGYFIYCMPHKDGAPEQQNETMERSFLVIDHLDFESFTKRWFEVAIRHPSLTGGSVEASFDRSLSSSPLTFSLQDSQQSPYYMHFEQKQPKHFEIPAVLMSRRVELNPDPQSRSDRPEWCFIQYDHAYHPMRGFQFEVQWMATTITLLNQLIHTWVHKASMCGFNLVAVPMLQSLSQEMSQPFKQKFFIPLELSPVFPGPDTNLSQREAVGRLLASILNRFGFLLDPACKHKESDMFSPGYFSDDYKSMTSPRRFYIHYSGCALVQPVFNDDNESEKNYSPQKIQEQPSPEHKGGIRIKNARECWKNHQESETDSIDSSSLPIGCSTPVESPSSTLQKGLWLLPEQHISSSNVEVSLKCGFYWYRNYLLPKQKNIPSSLVAQHDTLLAEFSALCGNSEDQLSRLCEGELSIHR